MKNYAKKTIRHADEAKQKEYLSNRIVTYLKKYSLLYSANELFIFRS